jgi:hypothetical protein
MRRLTKVHEVATNNSTARKWFALEGRVTPAFQLPLAQLQDDTRIALQLLGKVHVRAFAGESRKTYCGSCCCLSMFTGAC